MFNTICPNVFQQLRQRTGLSQTNFGKRVACDRLAADYRTEVIVPVREGIERFREQLDTKAPSG